MDKRYDVYSRRFIDALNNGDKTLPPRGNCIQLWIEQRRQREELEREKRRLQYLRRRNELLRKSQKDKPGKYR